MKNTAKIVPVMLLALVASVGCSKDDEKQPDADPHYALQNYIASLEEGENSFEKSNALLKVGVVDAGDSDVKYMNHYYRDESTLEYYYTDSYDEDERQKYIRDLTEEDTFMAFDNDVIVTRTDYKNYPYDASQLCSTDIDEDTGREYYTCDGVALVPSEYKDVTTIWKNEGKMNYVFERNEPTNAYSFSATVDYKDENFSKAKSSGKMGAEVLECYDSLANVLPQYKTAWGPEYPNEEVSSMKKTDKKLQLNYYLSFHTSGLMSVERIAINNHWNSDGTGKGFEGLYMEQGRTFGYEITVNGNNVTRANFYYSAQFRIVYKDTTWKAGDPTPAEAYLDDDEAEAMWPKLVIADSYGGEKNTFVDTKSWIALDEYEIYEASISSLGEYKGTLPDPDEYRLYDPSDVGSEFYDVQSFVD